MKKKFIRKIILWVLLLCWMIIIFLFSSQNGSASADVSSGIASLVMRMFPLKVDLYVLRKMAHFLEYMILGMLSILLIKEYRNIGAKEIIGCLLGCILYACSDEIHQLFVAGRSPQLFDVMIDTLGSMSGSFIFYFLIFPFHESSNC